MEKRLFWFHSLVLVIHHFIFNQILQTLWLMPLEPARLLHLLSDTRLILCISLTPSIGRIFGIQPFQSWTKYPPSPSKASFSPSITVGGARDWWLRANYQALNWHSQACLQGGNTNVSWANSNLEVERLSWDHLQGLLKISFITVTLLQHPQPSQIIPYRILMKYKSFIMK